MIKLFIKKFNIIIFILVLNITTSLMANKDDESDNLYLKKLKEYERSQKEIDLIFSEYCYFHNDSICFEDMEEESENENEIVKKNEGTTYYTSANVNLREKPNINSVVLILALRNEPIIIYQVSSENNNWFLAEYNNTIGYVNSNYITKDKPSSKQITKNDIKKKDQDNNKIPSSENEIDFEEYTLSEIKDCKKSYDPINSINLRDNHDNYCSCYPKKIAKVTTKEDIDYIRNNEEGSEEFLNKVTEAKFQCAVKTDYFFDFEISEELQKNIKKNIQACQSDYKNDLPISKKQFNSMCTCYENKWNSIVSKEDTDYFEKNNKPSDSFIEKEGNLYEFCISELS